MAGRRSIVASTCGALALLAVLVLAASVRPSGDAGAESPLATLTPTPTATPEVSFDMFGWRGEVPESGPALLTFDGEVLFNLERSAGEAGFLSVFATRGGRFIGYVVGAPEHANAEFRALFAGGIDPAEVFLVTVGEGLPPYSAGDVLTRLALSGFTAAPAGVSLDCDGTDAVPGVRYETSDGGAFFLWVYDDPESFVGDWNVEYPAGPRHRTFKCNYPPSQIYHNANLILLLRTQDSSAAAVRAGEVVTELGGGQLVAPTPTMVIGSLPDGSPFSGEEVMAALSAEGLTFVPYQLPRCEFDHVGVRQWYVGGASEEISSVEFLLWTYPDAAALEAAWSVGEGGETGAGGGHTHHDPGCADLDRLFIEDGLAYRHGNLMLIFHAWDTTEVADQAREAILGLQP